MTFRHRATAVASRLLLGVTLLMGLAAGLDASPVWAAQADPVLGAVAVDDLAGTVELRAVGPTAASVRFVVDGALFATSTYRSEVVTAGPFVLDRKVNAEAVGLDAAGVPLWEVERVLDPKAFAPDAPHVSLKSGRVVGRAVSFDISANETITGTFVAFDDVRQDLEATRAAGGSVRFEDVGLPYGPTWLTASVSNAFGRSKPARVRLYNVGTLSDVPSTARIVLVDKRAMRAYHLRNRRVLQSWPIATGMPSTPTPRGLFRLGSARPAGGAWGVLRRPLMKRSGSHWIGTSYYIHGTDAPWSIGMMASHGCVRMFNSHIRQFSRSVPSGTLVRIR